METLLDIIEDFERTYEGIDWDELQVQEGEHDEDIQTGN